MIIKTSFFVAMATAFFSYTLDQRRMAQSDCAGRLSYIEKPLPGKQEVMNCMANTGHNKSLLSRLAVRCFAIVVPNHQRAVNVELSFFHDGEHLLLRSR